MYVLKNDKMMCIATCMVLSQLYGNRKHISVHGSKILVNMDESIIVASLGNQYHILR